MTKKTKETKQETSEKIEEVKDAEDVKDTTGEKEKPQENKEESKDNSGEDVQDENVNEGEKEEEEKDDKTEFFSILDKMRKELDEKDKKLIEYIQAHKKHVSETDKVRERLRADFEKKIQSANAELLRKLFPVFDELELALKHAEKSQDLAGLLSGLTMTVSKLNNELESSGLERVHNKGKKFNPNLEEAVSIIPAQSEDQDDIIIEVLQPGYKIGENLIRPAKVVVGK
ncbi:MAG: nucleotide exchange factor GrpE, partial [Nitrospinae bacterium]|nr:nucleotide exchange factor GrpE [Nitrospinota bacterium]